ncbi:MAG: hypothetical protein ACYDBB_24435 [Armatimonadota bacterium]
MMSTRMSLCLVILIGLIAVVFAQEAPKDKGPMSVVVKITPTDKPMEMEALKPLLATNAADRLNVGWPAGMTENDHFLALVTGQYDKFNGMWPFKPPTGDPAKITKADYLEMIKQYPGLDYYVNQYGKEPVKASNGAYEAVPVFIAMYKATNERKYLEMTALAVKSYCLATDEDVAKHPTAPASLGDYWVSQYAYVYLPLLEIKDTPEFTQIMAVFGESIGKRANAWPLYPQKNGTNLGPLCPGFWYDLALKYSPTPIPRAAELKAYADAIWTDWVKYADTDEDDPNYTMSDLLVCEAWCRLRGFEWWKDRKTSLMWLDYAEQVGNDGSWPAYGDGGNIGRYFTALFACELAAKYTRDGRYRWFAHRAFWNGKERVKLLCTGIGYQEQIWTALGYLFADETIKEIPPSAGVTLTQRHWRDLTDERTRLTEYYWFTLQEKLAPSKLMFRSGPKETDDYLLMQVAQQGGHGHTDAGALSHYGGGLADYLDYATLRLDLYMEAHNIFTLRDPKIDKPWPGRWSGLFTTEDVTVPVMGKAADASYARVHIQEYPGTTTTAESWKEIQNWKGGWTKEKAIGYKNWPLRLDRSVLFVNNQFVVVRDVTNWIVPASAQMGQNWTFGELGSAGPNWVNVWMPKFLNGHYGALVNVNGRNARLSPVENAPRDLLIWYAPKPDGAMVIEKLLRERSELDCYVPMNSDMNLPLRSWYTRTGEWKPEEPQAFTTVLMPHAPGMDAAKLASSLATLQDTAEYTILQVRDGDTVRVIIMNTSGQPVSVGNLTTDAESAILTLVKGKPVHISAWHATKVTLGGKKLLEKKLAEDLDRQLK